MFTNAASLAPGIIIFEFEGRKLPAARGQSVAAALAAAGIAATRETPSGRPRAAYCMMGVCFECLVTIDGTPGRQGCLVTVEDGMRVSRGTADGATP